MITARAVREMLATTRNQHQQQRGDATTRRLQRHLSHDRPIPDCSDIFRQVLSEMTPPTRRRSSYANDVTDNDVSIKTSTVHIVVTTCETDEGASVESVTTDDMRTLTSPADDDDVTGLPGLAVPSTNSSRRQSGTDGELTAAIDSVSVCNAPPIPPPALKPKPATVARQHQKRSH